MIQKSTGQESSERAHRSAGTAGPTPQSESKDAGGGSQGGVLRGGGPDLLSPGVSAKDDDWAPALAELQRERPLPSLRAETGAALERQLLLVGGPGDAASGRAAGLSRGALWAIGIFVLLGILAGGLLLFVKAREHWESKIAALQGQITQITNDGAAREEALRQECVQKDREIAEKKTEVQTISALADKTLTELKTSLQDLRRLGEEKLQLEREHRRVLAQGPSFTTYFFTKFLPQLMQANSGRPPGDGG